MTELNVSSLHRVSATFLRDVAKADDALHASLAERIADERRASTLALFANASDELKGLLEAVDYTAVDQPQGNLRDVILKELKERDATAEVVREAARGLEGVASVGILPIGSVAETPIRDIPLFRSALNEAEVIRLADIIKLPEAKKEKLLEQASSVGMITEATIGKLVKEDILTKKEAGDLGLTATVHTLVNDRVDLTETLRAMDFGALGGRRLEALSDLALLSIQDWKSAVDRSGTSLPEGVSAESYAKTLRRRATKLFPSEALMAKVLPSDLDHLRAPLDRLRPLVRHNKKLFDTRFDDLDTSGVSAAVTEVQRAAHDELRRFANVNPGLGIISILNGNGNAAQKIEAIEKRLGLVKRFAELNPSVPILSLDTRPDSDALSALKWDGLRPDEQKMVLANIKAHQRTFALTRDIDEAAAILAAGYHSANAIASAGLPTFLADAELPRETATAHFITARNISDFVALAIPAMREGITGFGSFGDIFNSTPMSNVDPAIEDYLRKIDGYTEFFGSLDYCRCEHCRSIFSPAAYFVDLMYFVEVNVLNPYFSGAKVDHPLNLKVRRGDLWTLPLTCENTNTRVPYLDIINEVLENYIARRSQQNIDLTDRRAVEERVYRRELAGDQRNPPKVSSFQQPFVLPLERVQLYLAHFERDRGEVAAVLGAAPDVLAISTLGLSKAEFNLITTPDFDLVFLRGIFGAQFPEVGPAAPRHIERFDAQDMVRQSGITRDDLTALSAADFITDGGAARFRIVSEKRDPAKSVQNDIENVYDLTVDILDRIHRFTRLRRRVSWNIAELDLVLGCLKQAGLANGIDRSALENLVHVLALEKRWKLSPEQNCALWNATVPRRVVEQGKPSLFDRLFNFPPFLLIDGAFPKPAVRFVHPAFRQAGVSAPNDNTLHRLLAALQVSDEQLTKLLASLARALGFDPADAVENNRGPLLTEENLALLYRHAKLAQLLNLAVPELFQLIALGGIGGGHIATLEQVMELIALYDWRKNCGFKADEIGLITGGPVLITEGSADPEEIAKRAVEEIAKEQALQFADTVFAFLSNVTEAQSRKLIADNAAAFELVDPERRVLRLAVAFDPEADAFPAGGIVSEHDAKELLAKYHAKRVIPPKLAAALGISMEKVDGLIAMTGVDLASQPIVDAAWGGAVAPLVELVTKLIPLGILFRHAAFDAVALKFVRDHKDRFGIDRFDAIDTDAVRKLSVYSLLAGVPADAVFSADPIVVDAAAVQQAIIGFHRATRFNTFDPDVLARALRTEGSLIKTILAHVTLPTSAAPEPPPAPEALQVLKGCVELAHHLGIDGHALKRIIADGYEDLACAAEAVLSAFRAKYRDEKDFGEKLEPFENRLRGRRRDALVDYLIKSIHPEFESQSDLFHHFLIDVQLEGCARTSRVAAAISSLQLYVHRIRMNTEQDRRDPADPKRVHVTPDSIPADEWTWRKNYRVWEANRKVFLYPENYIEPDLRDDKTPLFQELESTLLQQEINEQTVLGAYAHYLSGFEEIASLKIAGSYHDKNDYDKSDILHLFGVTPSDPPVYYYRSIDNTHYSQIELDRPVRWGAWRKIETNIPVRKISPVVGTDKLFAFWIEIMTQPKSKVEGGKSEFVGYKHLINLYYTMLCTDNTWAQRQKLELRELTYVFPTVVPGSAYLRTSPAEGVIDDPLRSLNGIHGTHNQPIYVRQPLSITWKDYGIYDRELDKITHEEPIDGYTPQGFLWERVYPSVRLRYGSKGYGTEYDLKIDHYILASLLIDLTDNSTSRYYYGWYRPKSWLLGSKIGGDIPISRHTGLPEINRDASPPRFLYITDTQNFPHNGPEYEEASICTDERLMEYMARIWQYQFLTELRYISPIAEISYSDLIEVVNNHGGIFTHWIIHSNQQDFLVIMDATLDLYPHFSIERLGTKLAKPLRQALMFGGVDNLLSTKFQEMLGEPALPIRILERIYDTTKVGEINFDGSLGVYFREIFFHVPFLIGNYLNSQQRFAAAQRWYNFILDPTASETTDPATDRVWRYIEFRALGIQALRGILEDSKALGVYLKDPFNPHAIARLRLSAYQKTIYMKYIDNLLDWGDSLYAQYTAEAINEAMLLYVLASDMLGSRPAELGECGEGAIEPTYETIAPAIRSQTKTGPAPILIELENHIEAAAMVTGGDQRRTEYVIGRGAMIGLLGPDYQELADGASPSLDDSGIARPYDWNRTFTAGWTTKGEGTVDRRGTQQPLVAERLLDIDRPDSRSRNPGFAHSLVSGIGKSPAFCIPENKELRQYWDRVEDRLFKIRNCMDIAGVRRELPLFAPEIDPRLLVRARAAGLSLEDVLNAINGDLPPYRFTYLIEKAKAYAGILQGFGTALLGAIERRDNDELNNLRTIYQQNTLKMSSKLRDIEIETASEAYSQLDLQRQAIEYRRDYYNNLRDTSLTAWERTQQVSRHAASASYVASSLLYGNAGVLSLLPDLGSPFTLEYGGTQLKGAADYWAHVLSDTGKVAEVISASAGLEAGFQRRDEGWEHQEKLAQCELNQIEKQINIAELRKDTAARAKEIHDESVKQIEEVFAFNQERFTNFGLYTYLAATLQGIFREAYNNALAMARLAEQAYRFERGDDQAPVLQSSYWETGKAGLLAGEKLFIDLQNLERRFLETNYRSLEIDQPFSLSQIDPGALVTLKETGECSFSLPELFFDLFYPGQYRRRIRSVRLTIPCVTGPFTNVGATLSLTGSSIRREPKLGGIELKAVPLRRSVTIASSTAQNDAGVFEFSFRDERYMPFEGAGAVSGWTLSLPKVFKPFDYQTITDVILHVSYTAEYNGRFRADVEHQNAAVEGTILNVLSNVSSKRAFSLRQDFSTAFHRLLHSPADTEVRFAISDAFLPYFLKHRNVVVKAIKLVLRTAPDPNKPDQMINPGGFQIALDGNPALQNFTPDATLGNLWAAHNGRFVTQPPDHPLGKLLGGHSLTVKQAGNLAPQAPQAGDPSALDAEKLLDVVLYVEYHI